MLHHHPKCNRFSCIIFIKLNCCLLKWSVKSSKKLLKLFVRAMALVVSLVAKTIRTKAMIN